MLWPFPLLSGPPNPPQQVKHFCQTFTLTSEFECTHLLASHFQWALSLCQSSPGTLAARKVSRCTSFSPSRRCHDIQCGTLPATSSGGHLFISQRDGCECQVRLYKYGAVPNLANFQSGPNTFSANVFGNCTVPTIPRGQLPSVLKCKMSLIPYTIPLHPFRSERTRARTRSSSLTSSSCPLFTSLFKEDT